MLVAAHRMSLLTTHNKSSLVFKNSFLRIRLRMKVFYHELLYSQFNFTSKLAKDSSTNFACIGRGSILIILTSNLSYTDRICLFCDFTEHRLVTESKNYDLINLVLLRDREEFSR